jgi:glycosyltransferase involved in cell wall biosynthesis
MKITVAIIGSHGIPARYGGFETFTEHLAQLLSKEDFEITVVNERDNDSNGITEIKIIRSKYNKSQSPVAFYRDSISLVKGNQVVIVCGSAGSIYYTKIPKSFIITNIDGLEHKRKRYSIVQRMIVLYLQRQAVRRSATVVADSNQIKKYWTDVYPDAAGKIKVIPYGADECYPFDETILQNYSLKPSEYFLVIARLVPENNIEMILNAFRHYQSNKKLVIVGDADNQYGQHLKRLAGKRVVFTGSIFDKKVLDSLRTGCYLYIHGHSVGGTNPSLLEAMAAGCACLCHDNLFNRETTSDLQEYFKESYDLAIHLNNLEHNHENVVAMKKQALIRVKEFSWKKVSDAYADLIRQSAENNFRRNG